MPFNFMKQKQTWKSIYSTVRWCIVLWSSINFPSVVYASALLTVWFDWWIDFWCTLNPPFSLLNFFSCSISKCWRNYSGTVVLVKGICSAEVPPVAGEERVFASYDLSCRQLYCKALFLALNWPLNGCLLPTKKKITYTYNSLEMQIFNLEIAGNPDQCLLVRGACIGGVC